MNRPRRPGFSAVPILILAALLALPGAVGAQPAPNPIARYFTNLFDETRAESAVGSLLEEIFQHECKVNAENRIASAPDLDALIVRLAARTPRPSVPYRLLVLKSPIPGEIPFPGGLIVFTTGLLDLCQTPEEKAFLLARNLMHVALRHPLKGMKDEGLYARALKLLKQRIRNPDQERFLLRDYTRAAANMDQKRADREAVALWDTPETLRVAGISLLKRCSQAMWPAMPWDWFDLPDRITALEQLHP